MSKDKYENLNDDIELDLILELAQDDGVSYVLQIPGVWEFVREHYNNDVLRLYEERFLGEDEDDEE